MATLSSAGIGSGLDVKSIVTQLMALERQPITALQTNTKKVESQLSAYGKLQSAMTTLRDAAKTLSDAQTWSRTSVASSNTAAVTATSDGSAPPGSYTVNVTNLAAAQTLVTATTWAQPTDDVGPGTLTIELGRWGAGQTSFTPKIDTTPITITIPIGGDSLEEVRDAINGAGAGVSASIVTDANGSRLSIRSMLTGEANAFRISVNDPDGDNENAAGLSHLAYDPANSLVQMSRPQAGMNANATINNVPVSSATNTLTDVMDGMTLKLAQVTTAGVDVTVNRDTTSMKDQVKAFATAYNDLIKMVREQTSVNADAGTAGILQGDSSAVGLANQLRQLVGSTSGAATAFSRLSDIGLAPQRDGTLKVDETKLDSALGKLDELRTFFTRDEDGSAVDGFGALFASFGDQRLGADGLLSTRQEALRDRVERNQDRQSRMEDRLAMVEKRLTDQYSRLDTNIAKLSSLQNYVAQQIQQWNK
jgi:flagellar hook-associated protein 2